MNINWYPGHMKVAVDKLKQSLKLVDIVAEVIDARIPLSSRNPVLDDILENKARILILNKADLSDPNQNEKWKRHYEQMDMGVMIVDALNNKDLKSLRKTCEKELVEKRERDKKRNIFDDTIRMMIVGIPNVGKSTIINQIAGRSGARVGNKPGVTKANQWIKSENKIQLLDTPGVLWPKFEDPEVGLNLAFTGAITDNILDTENLALKLIGRLRYYEKNLKERYKIDYDVENTDLEIMQMIAEKRGAILKGGVIDYFKISNTILSEFRKGKIGRITLERI
ncbi:MAG: ribosome biogenesis GTPase YlqF [Tissierellia bacterium]|nr:ribosome biogenesis GTPase YlqF [Tissierellia bacterium]